MFIHLTEFFATQGKKDTLKVPVEQKVYAVLGDKASLLEAGPMDLTLAGSGKGRVSIKGNVNLTFQSKCDRCLQEIPLTLALSIDRLATSIEADAAEGPLSDNDFMDGAALDTELLLQHEILQHWPDKILCKEDCKGLCPKCGQSLNEGNCGCDTFVMDPRWAALTEIFETNKEV